MCGVLAGGALLPVRVFSEDLPWTLVRSCSEVRKLTSTPAEWVLKGYQHNRFPLPVGSARLCYLLSETTLREVCNGPLPKITARGEK